jgi:MYXO-CTERM domain-containing protein
VTKLSTLLISGVAFAAATQTQPVFADLGACNEINVTAQAQCEVVPPSVQCQQRCTPISIRATCSAQLAAECDASCSKLPSVECSGQCSASCDGKCKVDPGKFDCRVACEGDCSARCDASCKTKSNGAECQANCMGSCSVSCEKSCDVDLPSADCSGLCKASCNGSCRVDPNLDCQIDCQAKGHASCEAEVKGGCEVACQSKEGALFCDGQYVDHGDNLEMCLDALRARLNVRVTASSSGAASCDAGECTAKGAAAVSSDCSVSRPGSRHAHSGWWLGLMGLVGVARLRVKRGRKA